MARLSRLAGLVVGAAGALAGCGTGPEEFGACTGTYTIAVSAEPSPQFSWVPKCPILYLTVLQDRTIMWTVFREPPANQLEAPVRYGVTPPGFTAPAPSRLTPTIPYEVVLYRIDAEGSAVLVGRRSFLGAAP
jgi:hypothetical protein